MTNQICAFCRLHLLSWSSNYVTKGLPAIYLPNCTAYLSNLTKHSLSVRTVRCELEVRDLYSGNETGSAHFPSQIRDLYSGNETGSAHFPSQIRDLYSGNETGSVHFL